jgi:hypothetical protein
MKLELTRKQELTLIKLGLDSYLDKLNQNKTKTKTKPKKSGWSKERREKFAKSMARTWAKKNGTKKGNGKK